MPPAQTTGTELLEFELGRGDAQMAARVPVHRDESVDVCVHGLLREALSVAS
jgi:hypothetical protein